MSRGNLLFPVTLKKIISRYKSVLLRFLGKSLPFFSAVSPSLYTYYFLSFFSKLVFPHLSKKKRQDNKVLDGFSFGKQLLLTLELRCVSYTYYQFLPLVSFSAFSDYWSLSCVVMIGHILSVNGWLNTRLHWVTYPCCFSQVYFWIISLSNNQH